MPVRLVSVSFWGKPFGFDRVLGDVLIVIDSGNLSQGQHDGDCRSFSGRAVGRQHSAYCVDTLSNSQQAKTVVFITEIEAAAVIVQFKPNLIVVETELGRKLTGARVPERVGQSFLSDVQQVLIPFGRKLPWLALQHELGLEVRSFGHPLD